VRTKEIIRACKKPPQEIELTVTIASASASLAFSFSFSRALALAVVDRTAVATFSIVSFVGGFISEG
jgi:hypothetical protein